MVVHQRKHHPCVVGIGAMAMDAWFPRWRRRPGRLPHWCSSWWSRGRRREACEVAHQLQARIRNQEVRAVVVDATARRAQVSGPGSDDDQFPVPAG